MSKSTYIYKTLYFIYQILKFYNLQFCYDIVYGTLITILPLIQNGIELRLHYVLSHLASQTSLTLKWIVQQSFYVLFHNSSCLSELNYFGNWNAYFRLLWLHFLPIFLVYMSKVILPLYLATNFFLQKNTVSNLNLNCQLNVKAFKQRNMFWDHAQT